MRLIGKTNSLGLAFSSKSYFQARTPFSCLIEKTSLIDWIEYFLRTEDKVTCNTALIPCQHKIRHVKDPSPIRQLKHGGWMPNERNFAKRSVLRQKDSAVERSRAERRSGSDRQHIDYEFASE